MSARQRSGTGPMTGRVDETVKEEDILPNRDEASSLPDQGPKGKGVQANEYKKSPSNDRPLSDDGTESETKTNPKESEVSPQNPDKPLPTDAPEKVDRPGFDLGGSSGKTQAGKGLGLGTDAKENRKGWRLPR